MDKIKAEYRTQGTVCLSIGEKSTFTITPTRDYQVTHKKKKFLVLVPEDYLAGALLIELSKEGGTSEFEISFDDKYQQLLAVLAGNCSKAEFVIGVDGEPPSSTYTLKCITFPTT